MMNQRAGNGFRSACFFTGLLTALVLMPVAAQDAPNATGAAKSNESKPAPDTETLNRYFADKVFLLVEDFGRFSGSVEGADRIVVPLKQLHTFLERETSLARRDGANLSITGIDISGTLHDDRVDLEAKFAIQTGAANVRVPLEVREAHCRKATIDNGEPAALEKDVGGGYFVTIPRPGAHSLQLSLSVDAPRTTLGRRLTLTLPSSTAKQAMFQANAELAVAAITGKERLPILSADRRRLTVPLRSDESIELIWRLERDIDPLAAAGTSAHSEINVRLQDGTIETTILSDLTLKTGSTQLAFGVAAEDRVVSVDAEYGGGAMATRRTAPATERKNESVLNFAEKVSGPLRLRIVSQRALAADVWNQSVGQIAFRDVARQDGVIRIEGTRGRLARFSTSGSASRLPAAAWDQESLRRKALALFRFDSIPAGIAVFSPKSRPTISARCDTGFVVGGKRLQMRSKIRVNVRNQAIDALKLRVPRNLGTLEVVPADAVVTERSGGNSLDQEITLTFAEPSLGDLELQLSSTAPFAAGSVLRLPLPTVIDDPNCQVQANVSADDSMHVQVVDAESRNLVRFRPSESPSDGVGRRIYVRAVNTPAILALESKEIPFQTDAMIASTVALEMQRIVVRTTAEFKANREGIHQLRATVPMGARSIAYRIDDGPIERDGKAGSNVIELEEPASSCKLSIEYELTRLRGDNLSIGLPRFGADRVTSLEVAIQGVSNESYLVNAPWRPVERDATRLGGTAFASDAAGQDLIEVKIVPRPPGPKAWIPFRETIVVVDELGLLRLRCRYAISSVQACELGLSFAAGCAGVRAFVDGAEVALPARDANIVCVAIPASHEPRSLEIDYTVALGKSFGVFDRVEAVYHRFVDQVQLDSGLFTLYSAPIRLCVGEGCGVAQSDYRRGFAVKWLFGGRDLGAKDWFENQGLRLNWPKTTDSFGYVTSGYRRWSGICVGLDGPTAKIIAVYQPLWLLVWSGAAIAFFGALRVLRPAWRPSCVSAAVVGWAAFLAISPDVAMLAVSGASWGIAFELVGACARWIWRYSSRREVASRPSAVLTRRPGSSFVAVKPQPPVVAAEVRIASTMDMPALGKSAVAASGDAPGNALTP